MIKRIKNILKSNMVIMNLFYRFQFIIKGNRRNVKGSGNKISFNGSLLQNVRFNIIGNNNVILIGGNSAIVGCNFNIKGSNHLVDIGEDGIFKKCNFATEDHHCIIKIGHHVAMYDNCAIASVEPYAKVEIGNSCLFSSDIDIRNSDSHSIIDLDTKERINFGENIKINDKVWVGAYAQILKGAEIGSGSIIGIRSLVNKKVPSNSIAVGIPAKVVKNNVTWLNERIY